MAAILAFADESGEGPVRARLALAMATANWAHLDVNVPVALPTPMTGIAHNERRVNARRDGAKAVASPAPREIAAVRRALRASGRGELG
jgi:hypothetical protein